MSQTRIPIGVFAYNRPEHLQLTLEALGRCRGYEDYDLYIFCDAPRTSDDAESVEKARAVAREWVAERGGEVIEREKNMRFRNITSGITDLCSRYGRAVAVEDDLVVSPDFLEFMRAGLERYRDVPRVFHIAGFMYAVSHPPKPDAFFLPFGSNWGWATWERAWKAFEWEPSGWRDVLKKRKFRRRFDVGGSCPFSKMLKQAMQGGVESWAIRWRFAVFRAGGLSLSPRQSLVWNTGLSSGVHFSSRPDPAKPIEHFQGKLNRQDFCRPRLGPNWTLPDKIEIDEGAFERIRKCLARARGPLCTRLARKARRIAKQLYGRLDWAAP